MYSKTRSQVIKKLFKGIVKLVPRQSQHGMGLQLHATPKGNLLTLSTFLFFIAMSVVLAMPPK